MQAHGNHAGEGVDAAASENLAQVVVIVNADDAETVFQRKRACLFQIGVAAGQSGQRVGVGHVIDIFDDGAAGGGGCGAEKDCERSRAG